MFFYCSNESCQIRKIANRHITMTDVSLLGHVSQQKFFAKFIAIVSISIIVLFLLGCKDNKNAHDSSSTVKDIINQDIEKLIAHELESLDPSETVGMLRPGRTQIIGNSFKNMMGYAPEMNPFNSEFNEGDALYFIECLGKLFMVSAMQATPHAQELLNLPENETGEESAEGVRELRDRFSSFKPQNDDDIFVKEFMYAYLDNYYNFSVILEDLQDIFTKKDSIPGNSDLVNVLRSHSDNLRCMIYKPALGQTDIAIRKATWRAVEKLAKQAEAISR